MFWLVFWFCKVYKLWVSQMKYRSRVTFVTEDNNSEACLSCSATPFISFRVCYAMLVVHGPTHKKHLICRTLVTFAYGVPRVPNTYCHHAVLASLFTSYISGLWCLISEKEKILPKSLKRLGRWHHLGSDIWRGIDQNGRK